METPSAQMAYVQLPGQADQLDVYTMVWYNAADLTVLIIWTDGAKVTPKELRLSKWTLPIVSAAGVPKVKRGAGYENVWLA